MKILIAPDKFKHSLNSFEACTAIQNGLMQASEKFKIKILPLADGGDGLSEIINYYIPSKTHSVRISDPLFRAVKSSLLISDDGQTAFIEMAKASGLLLLNPEEYDCMNTSTVGTGELIKEAILLNVKKIVIGIGGSATNDCGTGMATALGYRFLDKNGNELKPTGKNLLLIEHINSSEIIDLKNIKFEIACDVKNPLTGKNGAARIYAKQKGATELEIEELEAGMIHFNEIMKKHFGKDISRIEGSGAAGGLAAGCIAFLNTNLTSGIDLVMNLSNAEFHINEADLVITGEGSIDDQSLNGKVISGLGELCKKLKKPLIAFCGKLNLTGDQMRQLNISSAYSIKGDETSLEEACKNAWDLLSNKAYETGIQLINHQSIS
ncbi:glycerate kinase [Pedobacter sp. P351]|uniref:glycerate kinase n=1 Tax=Pedobacter superstes TaxID=3133441 RepID=UPI0030B26B00